MKETKRNAKIPVFLFIRFVAKNYTAMILTYIRMLRKLLGVEERIFTQRERERGVKVEGREVN